MARFNYKAALKKRMEYPLMGGNAKYVVNGEIKKGDMWINEVLISQPESVLVVVPKGFLYLKGEEVARNELLKIYNVNVLVDVGAILGNGMVPATFLRLSKNPTKKVKIARFEGKTIATIARASEEVINYFKILRNKEIYDEADIELLRTIPELEYTDVFISFMNSIQDWVENNKDNIDAQYFHTEIKRDKFSNDRLAANLYTQEALDYYEYINNERFVPLRKIADVLSPFEIGEKMPKSYEVKKLGVGAFQYPLDYSNLLVGHPMRKVRLLHKGDIVASTLNGDGKLRVYLLEEEPKEEITCGIGCCIIRARNVSPEYLYLFLKSETADKYIFYNNPFLQISRSTLNEIPVSLPTANMEYVARLAFKTTNFMSGSVNLEEINEILREDHHIPREERPFQSVMLEELLGNIKIEKRNLIEDLIATDSAEMKACFDVGAYKSCLILCGSILETVLLDWLSEIENTNYFVDNQNMQINLYGVIQQLRDLYDPNWNSEAEKAHDVRLKRNLVHPVKYVNEHTQITRDVCLNVFDELREILLSRGIQTDIGNSKNY